MPWKHLPEQSLTELREFASDVALMKNRAARLGLWKTMHSLEPATQAVGWEIAEILEGKHPTKLKRVLVAQPRRGRR